MPNEDLTALEDKFVPLVTPVIVTREMRWENAETIQDLRQELNAAVNAWAQYYGDADLHAYLALYADNFSYRGMKLNEWASFRLQTLEQRGAVKIVIEDLLLLAVRGF